ncbi:MAG: lipase family alpha/beta hydrolase [Anaerolineae bacterium]
MLDLLHTDDIAATCRTMTDRQLEKLFGPHAEAMRLYAEQEPDSGEGDSLVVLLPGLTGSVLADGTDPIWLNPMAFVRGHLNKLDMSPDGRRDATPGVAINAPRPIWVVYGKLVLRMRVGFDVAVFPFDWRRSTAELAAQLADFVHEKLAASRYEQITLVGHSMGGLVALDYLSHPQTREQAEAVTKRLITLGAPFKGTLLAVAVLASADDPKMKAARLVNRANDPHGMLLTLPSMYELLPAPNSLYINYDPAPDTDLYDPLVWQEQGVTVNADLLAAAQRRHLRMAQADPQVEVINVIGSYFDTPGRLTGSLLKDLSRALFIYGDGTVDIDSAILNDGAEAYYLQEDHVELVLDNSVIRSVMAWCAGGEAGELSRDPEHVTMDEGRLRSAAERVERISEEGIAEKLAADDELDHDEILALMSPLQPTPKPSNPA